MLSEANLPDDIEALKALVLASQQEALASQQEALASQQEALASQTRLKDAQSDLANKDKQIVRLEKLISDLQRTRFGVKSEKIDPSQLDLTFEDIEVAIEATQTEIDATGSSTDDSQTSATSKPARKANRGHLPRHFERVEVLIEPEEGTTCPCGNACHVIGEDTSERLEIIPAQFRVIVTKRPKYACRACERGSFDAGILQAPAPKHIVAGGIPTESTLAHVIVSKYADHLPLYRQAQIYGRQGLDLDRSTLAGWVGKASYYLQPVYEHLLADLKSSNKLFMDETPAPVLAPGKKKVHKGYFWALARNDQPWGGDDPPGVAFTYSSGRSGTYAEEMLKDFNGTLQVDGYSGYNRLQTRSERPIKLAYCWAHARRKLFDVHKSNQSEIAADGIKQIARLYQIETEIRGMTPAERLSVREQRSTPLITAFKSWLGTQLARVSGKTPLGEALRYIDRHMDGLALFLTDGQIELDNNSVERTIRPIALSRKNALFAGHEQGAQNWAMIASLIETCKLNQVNPQAWLDATLQVLANQGNEADLNALMPWNSSSKAEAMAQICAK